ncbi:MAG: outer membrane lipoprotein carrier protein LolA [Bacteroidales bacterium]|nr:outer membrane lipoprotein carrier protein LolA [Bacteroidales bacterium]
MKKILTACTLLLALFAAQAQITHTDKGGLDKRADEILKRAAAKMGGTVSFDVKATMTGADKKVATTANAAVLYSKGRYRMTADDYVLYCDGSSVCQWNRQAKELVINPMAEGEVNLMNPSALLANYAKNFRPKYIRTEPDGTAVIDLQPRQAASYHKVRLLITEKSGLLKKIEVHRYDSSREEFVISRFANARATEADFRFDTKAHPEVEVIDMR